VQAGDTAYVANDAQHLSQVPDVKLSYFGTSGGLQDQSARDIFGSKKARARRRMSQAHACLLSGEGRPSV
jgi:hypothetical protein